MISTAQQTVVLMAVPTVARTVGLSMARPMVAPRVLAPMVALMVEPMAVLTDRLGDSSIFDRAGES